MAAQSLPSARWELAWAAVHLLSLLSPYSTKDFSSLGRSWAIL